MRLQCTTATFVEINKDFQLEYFKNFVDVIKLYEGLHEYGGVATYSEILEMPYPLFYELITKQVELKKKEKEHIDSLKNNKKGSVIAGGKVYKKEL